MHNSSGGSDALLMPKQQKPNNNKKQQQSLINNSNKKYKKTQKSQTYQPVTKNEIMLRLAKEVREPKNFKNQNQNQNKNRNSNKNKTMSKPPNANKNKINSHKLKHVTSSPLLGNNNNNNNNKRMSDSNNNDHKIHLRHTESNYSTDSNDINDYGISNQPPPILRVQSYESGFCRKYTLCFLK